MKKVSYYDMLLYLTTQNNTSGRRHRNTWYIGKAALSSGIIKCVAEERDGVKLAYSVRCYRSRFRLWRAANINNKWVIGSRFHFSTTRTIEFAIVYMIITNRVLGSLRDSLVWCTM